MTRATDVAPPLPLATEETAGHETPSVDRPIQRHLPKTKHAWSIANLPSIIGRSVVGIAVVGAMLGTLGDSPQAGTRTREPQRVEVSVTPAPAPAQSEPAFNAEHALDDVFAVLGPLGVSREQALSAIGYVTFTVTVDRSHLLSEDGLSGLVIEPGTTITANLNRDGLTFSAEPHLTWRVNNGPDAEIERLTYHFDEAQFSAEAGGFGPDFIYEHFVTKKVNSELTRRLPASMLAPGYDPFADPHLATTVQQLVDNLTATSDPSTGAARTSDHTRLSAARLSFDFTVPDTLKLDLPGGEMAAWIDRGTTVSVSIATQGAINGDGRPGLDALSIRFSKPVEVAKAGERPTGFGKIDLHAMTLRPGGQLELEYELGPEQAIDGVRGLFTLIAAAADPRVLLNADMHPTRLEGGRRQVQEKIDGTIEPRLIELIRGHDSLISNFSLSQFFGVE